MRPSFDQLRNVMHVKRPVLSTALRPETYLNQYINKTPGGSDVAELFHENSKYRPQCMQLARRSTSEFDKEYLRYVQSRIKPDYRSHERVQLPPNPSVPDVSIAEVLASRRTPDSFRDEPLPASIIAAILSGAAGITARVSQNNGNRGFSLRAYPSAGALYPIELYPVVRRSSDFNEGLYYYPPGEEGVRLLRGDTEGILDAFVVEEPVRNAALIVILTSAFWRAKAKYGPRGYRYALQESGHIGANISLLGEGFGVGTVPLGGFYDDRVNDWLGIDGVNEAAVYALAIGYPGRGD